MDRRKFLKVSGFTVGGITLANTLSLPVNAGLHPWVGKALWVILESGAVAVLSEIAKAFITKDGRVGYENAKVKFDNCGEIYNIGSDYNGRRKNFGKYGYGTVTMDANLVANLGGSTGRNIVSADPVYDRGYRVGVQNDRIFDIWEEQGVDITDYRKQDSQWSIKADRYPGAFNELIINWNHTKKIEYAGAAENVDNFRPIGTNFHFQRHETVWCYTKIINSIYKNYSIHFVNRRGYHEAVVRNSLIETHSFRTQGYKENNPYPGSWAAVISINNEVHEVVGFQWS